MTPPTARGFAPGKLILTGEHAVVYGHRAVAFAVDRGTTVTLARRPGASGLDVPPPDARLPAALATLLPPEGVGVTIKSDLPVGRGMGSSAALAVALVRALAALEGRTADFDECHAQGFAVERVFHGEPSGIDHAVSARGGGVVYRRGPAGPELEPLLLPPLDLVVLDSGAMGDTGALVAGVRSRRPGVDPVLASIGALAEQVVAALRRAASPAELGPLLTQNHALLADLGVSTPALDALVELALAHGAHGAKLAGAGGGGVVLALVTDPGRLLRAADAQGVAAFRVGVAPAGE